MKAPTRPAKKTMGKKVGQHDPMFESALKESLGSKNAKRIMSKPSAMKRAYGMYLKGTLSEYFKVAHPDDIPF